MLPHEIARFRALSGDTDPREPDLSDEQIASYYEQAGENEAATMVLILRHRMGILLNKAAERGEFGTQIGGEQFDRVAKVMLPYWEARAEIERSDGSIEGGLAMGALLLGIDATCETTEDGDG